MVLQITNTCRMGCPHCMECSTPQSQHMTGTTFEKFIRLISEWPQNAILVGGGEPTEHPQLFEMLEEIIPRVSVQCLLVSNGMWLGDPDKELRMFDMLQRHDKFGIQITSYEGLYQNCADIRAKCRTFMLHLKSLGLKKRMTLSTDRKDLHMRSLGRCKDHPELMEEARKDPSSTSCIMHWSFVQQFKHLDTAITMLNLRGHFCFPFVDWMGGLHFSESWICPQFATVSDGIEDIRKQALAWKPCGECKDFEKVLTNPSANYVHARKLLGI